MLLQEKLGLGKVPTLDIRQQCTGFIYGLQVADALLRTKVAKRLLLVGAEVHSGFMPWRDHGIVFGTSSAKPTPEEFAFATRIAIARCSSATAPARSCSSGATTSAASSTSSCTPTGTTRRSCTCRRASSTGRTSREEMIREGRHIPEMDGQRVFRMAVSKLPEAVHEVLQKSGHTLDDVSLLLAHQANLRLNEAVQKALGLGDDRVYNNIQRYGNTTAATIPILYDECRRSGAHQARRPRLLRGARRRLPLGRGALARMIVSGYGTTRSRKRS